MTFCIGLKSADGLVALADTRITNVSMEVSTAPKISMYDFDGRPLFVLTSGLRSLRDKVLTYFAAEAPDSGHVHAYEAVNALAEQMRRVRSEDAGWLRESGLTFDLNCIVGGRLAEDARSQMFQLYPEGNWVEVNAATPYVIIGDSRYGKPALAHLWSYGHTLEEGLRAALVAFTETRGSAANVDYPVDVIMLCDADGQLDEMRVSEQDGAALEAEWRRALLAAADGLAPAVHRLYARLQAGHEEEV